jgi:hypothetical protein
MIRDGAIMLAFATLPSGSFAQNEKPQFSECLHQVVRGSELVPQRNTALDHAFQAIYDLDFHKADENLLQFIAARPHDPLGPAAQAASALFSIFEQQRILQSEFFTSDERYKSRRAVIPDEDSVDKFEYALNRAEELANQSLGENGADEDALFALTLVYGLRADYTALVERRDVAALRFSNEGTRWARKLLSASPNFYDAYVATGIQKYLVGLRPAPARWILRLGGIKGDRDAGMRELELAACKGHYLGPFARMLLAIAHLRRLESKEALEILHALNQQFPHNSLFAEEIARISQSGTSIPQASALSTHSQKRKQ